jgi:hypothetical protein
MQDATERKYMEARSEQVNELLTALSKAQGEMASATMDKESTAFGGRKYKYASLTAILKVVKPVLSKNGLCITQMVEKHNSELSLMTMIGHSSGQYLQSWIPLMVEKNTSQGLGSAITYARRYAMSAVAGVETDEDDDGLSAEEQGGDKKPAKKPAGKSPVQPKIEMATPAQIDMVKRRLVDDLKLNKQMGAEWLKKHSPKPSSKDWTAEDAFKLMLLIDEQAKTLTPEPDEPTPESGGFFDES